jgi:hypothetical protein
MKVTLTLDIDDHMDVPTVIRWAALQLENCTEDDVSVMDGSLPIRNSNGDSLGYIEFDHD